MEPGGRKVLLLASPTYNLTLLSAFRAIKGFNLVVARWADVFRSASSQDEIQLFDTSGRPLQVERVAKIFSNSQFIVALDLALEDANSLSKLCYRSSRCFLWLKQHGTQISLFSGSMKDKNLNPYGFTRPDDRAVFIDRVEIVHNEYLVVTQIPHGLQKNDQISIKRFQDCLQGLRLHPAIVRKICSETEFKVTSVKVVEEPDSVPADQKNLGHIFLLKKRNFEGGEQEDPCGHEVLLEQSLFAPQLVHIDGICPAVKHAAFIFLETTDSSLHNDGNALSECFRRFTPRCRCTKNMSQSSAKELVWKLKKESSTPSYLTDNSLGLSLVYQVLSNYASKRFKPLEHWLHLDIGPTSHEIIPSPLASGADKDTVCISGLGVLGFAVAHQLIMNGMKHFRFRRLILLPSTSSDGVNQELLADDVTSLLTPSDLWGSVAQKLKEFRNQLGETSPEVEIISAEMNGETERRIFNAEFFKRVALFICTEGSYEDRRYIGGLSVTHKFSLIDSSVDNLLGHVETFVPQVTESRTCAQDPSDEISIPFCVLKSFPQNSDHCVLWASHKMNRLFRTKPSAFNEFFKDNSSEEIINMIRNENLPDGCVTVYKLLRDACSTWEECVRFSRQKFEKYFRHKTLRLLHHFPPDATTNDGLFWAYPKKVPSPGIDFSPTNKLHLEFVRALANCWAQLWNVQVEGNDLSDSCLIDILSRIVPEPFSVGSKSVVTDESVTQDEANSGLDSSINFELFIERVQNISSKKLNTNVGSKGWFDLLLESMARLRCENYQLPVEVSCILPIARNSPRCRSESTRVISQLILIEAWRLLSQSGSVPSNWWISLYDPWTILKCDPIRCSKRAIGSFTVTLWDQIEIRGKSNWTLQEFLGHVESALGFEIGMVIQGSKMIYVHFMPNHKSRLPQLMSSLVSTEADNNFAVLSVTSNNDLSTEEPVPPIRYFIN